MTVGDGLADTTNSGVSFSWPSRCQELRYPWLLSCSEHRVPARYHSNLHPIHFRHTTGKRSRTQKAAFDSPKHPTDGRGRLALTAEAVLGQRCPRRGNVNIVLERSTNTTFPPWLIFCGCLLVSCQPVSSSSSLAMAKQSSPVAARSTNRTEPLPQASSPGIEIRNGPIAGSIELAARATGELAPDLIVGRGRGLRLVWRSPRGRDLRADPHRLWSRPSLSPIPCGAELCTTSDPSTIPIWLDVRGSLGS